MTYKKFVRHMVKETGLLREDVCLALKLVFDNVKSVLLTGESVSIPELGTFYLRMTKPKIWVQPSTGDVMDLNEKVKLKFRPSRKFVKFINQTITEMTNVQEDDV